MTGENEPQGRDDRAELIEGMTADRIRFLNQKHSANEEVPESLENEKPGWLVEEEKICRQESDEAVRLFGAIEECRQIVRDIAADDYARFVLEGSCGHKRDFKHGVTM